VRCAAAAFAHSGWRVRLSRLEGRSILVWTGMPTRRTIRRVRREPTCSFRRDHRRAISGAEGQRSGRLWEYAIDIWHLCYAAGYLKPGPTWPPSATSVERRSACRQSIAVRAHYGLFMFGMDLVVINVTKDAVWARNAPLSMTRRRRLWTRGGAWRSCQNYCAPDAGMPHEDQRNSSAIGDRPGSPPPDVYHQPVQWPA
jgi:hypothetical protein